MESKRQSISLSPTSPPRFDLAKFFWEVIKGVALGIAAVFSFFSNQGAEQAKLAAEETKRVVEVRSQQAQLDIKAYELVERALSLEPGKRQQQALAAAAIVNALTNPPLRDGLQGALGVGAAGDQTLTKQLDNAREFDRDEYRVSPAPLPPAKRGSLDQPLWSISFISSAFAQSGAEALRKYQIDVFYCEAASQSLTELRKKRATDAAEKLEKRATEVVVRVRLLPVLVQARQGYHSSSDEIRFNDESNAKLAASQLAKIIGIQEREVRQITFRTPNYLSVFYCADK